MGLDGAAMRKPWLAIYGMRRKVPAKASIWTGYWGCLLALQHSSILGSY